MKKIKKRAKKAAVKGIHSLALFLMLIQNLALPLSAGAILTPRAAIAEDGLAIFADLQEAPEESSEEKLVDEEPSKEEADPQEKPEDDSAKEESGIKVEEESGEAKAEEAEKSALEPEKEPDELDELIENSQEEGDSQDKVEEAGQITPEAAYTEAADDQEAENKDEKEGDWKENEDGSSSVLVVENKEYEYKDSGLKIEFSKLKDGRGEINVKEIELTDEQAENLNAISKKAWDITSDMQDGDFEYKLTLPLEESVSADEVKVVYAEEKDDLNDESKVKEVDKEDVKVDNDKKEIKAENLDHFTVFAIVTYSDISLTVQEDTYYRENVETVYFKVTGLDINKYYKVELDEPGTTSDHWLGDYVKNRTEFTDSYGPFKSNDNLGTWYIRLWEADNNKGNNRVEVKNVQFNLVDSPLPSSVNIEQWQTKSGGGWIPGNLGSNNSDYTEGETIPFRLDAGKLNSSGNPYTFSVCRDFDNGTKRGYFSLMPFNTTESAVPGGTISDAEGPFSGVNVTNISFFEVNGQGNCGSGQRETQVSFDVVSSSLDTYLLWGGKLATDLDAGAGNGAASYPGSSLSMQLLSPAKNLSINPGAIIQLAYITVTKVVDSGAATPDQWGFNITPNPNNISLPLNISTGQNSVQFLSLPSGSYQITETSVSGYSFVSGSGTNCTFSESTANCTVTAATNATNASATFYNAVNKGSITIIKNAVPDDPQDFAFTTTGKDLSNFSLDDDNDPTLPNTKTFSNLLPGSFSITEGVVANWDLTGINCVGGSQASTNGNIADISLGSGENVICTFTNTKQNPLIDVQKSSTTTSINTAGQVVPYTFTVTNIGNMTLTGISVTDPNCDANPAYQSGDTNGNDKLELSETWTYTCSHTVTQGEIDSNGGGDGDIDNTVTADSSESDEDTDDYSIPIEQSPSLDVTKDADVDSVDEAGDLVTYTIEVKNTGNQTLTGVSVSDPLLADLDCDGVPGSPYVNTGLTINVGATLTCIGTYTVLQADIDNYGGGDGDIDNTVTADSDQTDKDTASETVAIVQTPLINIEKSSTTTSINTAGQVVPYTFTVTNIGNMTLTGISVTDPNCDANPAYQSGDTNGNDKLELSETWTYTCSHTVTQGEIDSNGGGDGDIDNTVTADSSESDEDTDDYSIPIEQSPSLDVTKDADVDSVDEAGDLVTYTIEVKNTGNQTLTGVSVSDPLLADLDCDGVPGSPYVNTGLTINVGATLTCIGTYTVLQADIDNYGGGDGDIDNTVTADSDQTDKDTASETVAIVQTPLINIEKSSTTTSINTAGQVVPYTFTVTNIGNMTLTGISVTDPNCDANPAYQSGDTNGNDKLELSETWTYTCSHTVTQGEIDSNGGGDGDIDNTVTADSSESDEDTDDYSIPIEQSPSLDVTKDADVDSVDEAGDLVTYTIEVKNTGNQTLTGVSVSDPLLADLDCDGVPGSPYVNTGLTINVGATLTCIGTYTVLQADIDNYGGGDGDIDNTVTADSDQTDKDTASETVAIVQTPLINIEKSSTTTSINTAGQVVPYTFTVTNIGNMTLTGISVTDPNCDANPAYQSGDTNGNDKLELSETWTYTCSHTVTQGEIDSNGGGDGDIDNTVTADSSESDEDTDDYSIPIEQSPSLDVTKDADVDSVDEAGDLVTYTIEVKNTGNQTLTGVSVSDPLLADLDCDGVPGSPYVNTGLTINVGATLTCIGTYTVLQADIDNYGGGDGDIDNTVTADSDQTDKDTASETVAIVQTPLINIEKSSTTTSINTAGQVVPYTFTVTNIGNMTLTGISVTDPNCDANPAYQSGDTNGNDKLELSETWTYTCSHTVTQGEIDSNGGGDGDIDNTVTADSSESDEDTDDYSIPIEQSPSLDVTKDADVDSVDEAGDLVTYTIEVKNTGNQTLTGVSVSDPLLADLDCDGVPGSPYVNTGLTINVGATLTCIGTYTVLQADIDNYGGGDGDIDNTVTADSDQTDKDTASETVAIVQTPLINIEKSSTTTSINTAGQVVPYTFTVTNIGNMTLTGISVTDPNCDANPAYQSGDTNGNDKLELSETWTYTCSHTVTQGEIDGVSGNGKLTNKATADSKESDPDDDEIDTPIEAGKIIIEKQTLPDGSPQSFEFDPSWSTANFNLLDNGTKESDWLAPGSYSASEINLPTGWDPTDITCDDYNSGASRVVGGADISLEAGETVTCVFTNTQRGSITIVKDAQPNDPQDFQFTGNLPGSPFDLDDDSDSVLSDSKLFDNLEPNVKYNVTESNSNLGNVWDLENITCEGTDQANIEIDIKNRSAGVSFEPGENVTCTFTNTKRGSITAHKFIDTDQDGIQESGEADKSGWLMTLYSGSDCGSFGQDPTALIASGNTDSSGDIIFSDLKKGKYSVMEELPQGWTNGSTNICQNVELEMGKNETVDFGNFQWGIIEGMKYEDKNGSGDKQETEEFLEGWEIRRYDSGWSSYAKASTDADGKYQFGDLPTGTYYVCEALKEDWKQTAPILAGENVSNQSTNKLEEGDVCWKTEITQSGQTIQGIDFGNFQYGEITVTKFEDADGDGRKSEEEKTLPDWEIFLGELPEGPENSKTTDENGQVVFGELAAGSYKLSENIKPGWEQTNIYCEEETVSDNTDLRANSLSAAENDQKDNDNDYPVEITSGKRLACYIGNQFVSPELTIEKFNDQWPNVQDPGDIVDYTITLHASKNRVNDVIVKDLMPEGFSFVSITSVIKNGTDNLSVPDPAYASPGSWQIGDMEDGDVVIIKFKGKIGSDQDPGTYKDLAWAQGTDDNKGEILATSVPASPLAGNDDDGVITENFVGTQIELAVPVDPQEVELNEETKTKTKTKERVLGASTDLPATGSPTALLLIAIGTLLAGLGLIFAGRRKSNSISKIILLVFFLSVGAVFSQKAEANGVDPKISVRIEEPQSPIDTNTFKIGFVMMDIEGEKLSAKCFVGDVEGTEFPSSKVEYSELDGGNSGNCLVDSQIVPADGTYKFYVEAWTEDSRYNRTDTVSVEINSARPERVHNYDRDGESCDISFRTADDGLTAKVELYRSKDLEFTADASTFSTSLAIGPNQSGNMTDPLGDCDLYYYAVRAVSASGAGSSFVGDEDVDIETETKTKTIRRETVSETGGGAIPVESEAEAAQGESAEGGEIAGEETESGEKKAEEETGKTAGEEAEAKKSQSGNWPWYLLGGLIVVGLYYFLKKRSSGKKKDPFDSGSGNEQGGLNE